MGRQPEAFAARIERGLRDLRGGDPLPTIEAELAELPLGGEVESLWRIVARERARAAINGALVDFDNAQLERIASPIEMAMLVALHLAAEQEGLRVFLGNGSLAMRNGDLHHGAMIGNPDHLVITPQVEIGKYRADFHLRYGDYAVGQQGITEVQAILECDGHDFHERTKEQAQHDRKRDRVMQDLGFVVLRFTGSEIWSDPIDCAKQVLTSLRAQHHRAYSQGGAS